jgi:hypothetical protein
MPSSWRRYIQHLKQGRDLTEALLLKYLLIELKVNYASYNIKRPFPLSCSDQSPLNMDAALKAIAGIWLDNSACAERTASQLPYTR